MVEIVPHWTSLIPPIVAIGLALTTRQVILSLFLGVFAGSLIIFGWNPLTAFLMLIDRFVLPALADRDHAAIIIFSMMLGGMVGIVQKSGGAAGIVAQVERIARSARMGQLATWIMGIAIFFDDYANTLIVGNTMRPITDRFRISREKLSYIVDSTAAPIAGLFLSTWIGYEIGVIGDSMQGVGFTADPFSVFVMSIPYRFYAILAILFVAMVAVVGRDFGPMLHAERRARTTGELLAPGAEPAMDLTETTGLSESGSKVPPRWINGVLPIVAVIVVTILGIWQTGAKGAAAAGVEPTVRTIMAHANSSTALFWGSLSGCAVGIVLVLMQRILSLHQAFDAWFHGVKSMLLAMIILILAWSIGSVTRELRTAEYIVQVVTGSLPLWALPVITFAIAGFVSFATGTSWGTMAILMPLVVPLVWNMAQEEGLAMQAAHGQLFIAVSAVLAGAIWGDHCSPISDTTVMSSMASGCDHVDHVRTQLPYAMAVGVVSMAALIGAGRGFSPWILLGAAVVVLIILLLLLGRRPESQGRQTAAR